MRYLLYILLFVSASVYGQTTYKILADSTRLGHISNTGNELILENDTRDTLGFIYNTGAGRTTFKALRLQQLTDSTFRLLAGTTQQGQTIKITPGSGGGGGVTYTLTKNATKDSIILTGSNGTRYAAKDSSGVPYIGAVTDVDLGANSINAKSLNVTGTNGSGHIHLRHQASDATATGQTTSLFANSSGDLKYKNDNLYYTTFKTSGNTANREYRFPDSTGTVALLSNIVNIYNSNGNIPDSITRNVNLSPGGTVMFTSQLGDKGIVVGDSLRFWYGQGEINAAIDGASIYKTYIDTNNNEGYTAFHNVYNLGATTLSYSGMRDMNENSESLFGTFHINGQTGASAYYSNWGYTNPTTEEAIGIQLRHGGSEQGFRLMPYSEGTGYTFKSDSVFRVYDTLRNTILATDVDGNVKIEATGDLSFVGLPTGGAADTFVTVTNTAGVVTKKGASEFVSGGGATTIYNGDGTLSGDRTVSGAGNDLIFTDNGVFVVNQSAGTYSDNDLVTSGYKMPIVSHSSGAAAMYLDANSSGGDGVIIAGTGTSRGILLSGLGGGRPNADIELAAANGNVLMPTSLPTNNANTTLLTLDGSNWLEKRTLSSLEYVDSIYRTPGKDSLFYTTIDGRTIALKDSTGGGSTPTLTYAKNTGKDSSVVTYNGVRTAVKDEGWVLLGTATASNSATIEFTIDTTIAYRKILLDVDDLYSATNNVDMWLRIGFGATPTYASGASDYTSVLQGSVGSGFNLGDTKIKIMQNSSSTYPQDAIIEVHSPTITTGKKTIYFRGANNDSGTPTYNYYFIGNGKYNINNRPYAGIQILMSSGNITSGTFYLYGIK